MTTGGKSSNSAFIFSVRISISIAVLIAISWWLSQGKGAPQKAMTQSPIYLSTVPPFFNMTFVISFKKWFIRSTKPSGSSFFIYFSEIGVKPTISANKNVISFLSPPNFISVGSLTSISTISGDRYVPNCPLICFLSFHCSLNLR